MSYCKVELHNMTRNVLCTTVYIANSIERVGEQETERYTEGNGMLLLAYYLYILHRRGLTTSPTVNATTRGHRHAITAKGHRQNGLGHLLASPQTHPISHRNSSFKPWLFSPHTPK